MYIPYTTIKAAHDSGTPLTGFLKTIADKGISDHDSRIANSSWWGKPVGQFQHSATADADWINAIRSSAIGTTSRDGTRSSSFDIPYYETFVGQSGPDSYGYGDSRDGVTMSPQAFRDAKTPLSSKTFSDVAIPLYGNDGSVTGYAVPTAFIAPEYRVTDDNSSDFAEISYRLNYDQTKLKDNSVRAKLPGVGDVFLFKGEQSFNDVFGANPEPEFKSIIHKPEPMSWGQIALTAVSALGSFGGAASFANALGMGSQYASIASTLGSIGSSAADLVGATGDVAKAISSGVNSAVMSGAKTALTGGDFSDVLTNAATSGVTGGAASLAGNTVSGLINGVPSGVTDDQYTSVETASQTDRFPLTGTLAGAAAGATGGLINAGLTGGDIGDAALTGAVAGGVSGGVGADLGAGGAVGNVAGNLAGGLVNQALQPDPAAQPAAPVVAGTDTTDTAETDTRTHDYALDWGNSPSFASLLPQTSRPAWGTRLNNGRPA